MSFYTLEHTPRDEHRSILQSVWDSLRSPGYLLICLEASDMQDRTAEWLGVPMYFSAFGPEKTISLVQEAGFEIVETAVENQVEQSHEIPYLWVLARKTDSPESSQPIQPTV
jgi:hypothetical protein